MNFESFWPLAIVAFVIIPFFFWLRVRAINKRKEMVDARCKTCGVDHRLPEVENFKCKECGSVNLFLDEDGKPLKMVRTYKCEACGAENFVGILTCTACGKGNKEGIPT